MGQNETTISSRRATASFAPYVGTVGYSLPSHRISGGFDLSDSLNSLQVSTASKPNNSSTLTSLHYFTSTRRSGTSPLHSTSLHYTAQPLPKNRLPLSVSSQHVNFCSVNVCNLRYCNNQNMSSFIRIVVLLILLLHIETREFVCSFVRSNNTASYLFLLFVSSTSIIIKKRKRPPGHVRRCIFMLMAHSRRLTARSLTA